MACDEAVLLLPRLGRWGCCQCCRQSWGAGKPALKALGTGTRASPALPPDLPAAVASSGTQYRPHPGVWENLCDLERETHLHGEAPVGQFSQDLQWHELFLPSTPFLMFSRSHPSSFGFNVRRLGLRFSDHGSCATNLRYANSKQQEKRE